MLAGSGHRRSPPSQQLPPAQRATPLLRPIRWGSTPAGSTALRVPPVELPPWRGVPLPWMKGRLRTSTKKR